jgi:hypothetical protein
MTIPASPISRMAISGFLGRSLYRPHRLILTDQRSSSDIRDAFHKRAVPGLLRLVENQVTKAESKGLRVTVSRALCYWFQNADALSRELFLSGGLARAPIYINVLRPSTSTRELRFVNLALSGGRPHLRDNCWRSIITNTWFKRRTAICRGAILKGLMDAPITTHVPNAPEILSRISRTCIGTTCNAKFIEGVHRKKERYICEHEGFYKVRGMMDWYITKVCALEYVCTT